MIVLGILNDKPGKICFYKSLRLIDFVHIGFEFLFFLVACEKPKQHGFSYVPFPTMNLSSFTHALKSTLEQKRTWPRP
jgi:hypothetical protein